MTTDQTSTTNRAQAPDQTTEKRSDETPQAPGAPRNAQGPEHDQTTFAAAWHAWHDQRVTGLTGDRHGWLSVVALDWLAPGQTRAYADGAVTFSRSAAEPLQVTAASPDGQVVVDLATSSPQFFEYDDVRYELLLRLDVEAAPGTAAGAAPAGTPWVGVRVRDPKSALLAGTHDVPAFEADPAWRLTGTFTPFAVGGETATGSVGGRSQPEARSEVIDTAAEGLRVLWPFIGTVDVDIAGEHYALKAGGDPAAGLSVSFHDATNGAAAGDATSAWRAVGTSPVAADGTVTIDFNRATNFPAGFTSHATCPAPPVGNTIRAAVTAGEKVPWHG